MPNQSCEWWYNSEFDRWETECEDLIALFECANPRPYGFKWCPFCGRPIQWESKDD
jgi:hypothetical protein